MSSLASNPINKLQAAVKAISGQTNTDDFEDDGIKVEKKKYPDGFDFVYLKNNPYKVGWILDCETEKCMSCQSKFFLWKRKHHCRACGIIICNSCSSFAVDVRGLGEFEPKGSRICSRFCAVHMNWKYAVDEKPRRKDLNAVIDIQIKNLSQAVGNNLDYSSNTNVETVFDDTPRLKTTADVDIDGDDSNYVSNSQLVNLPESGEYDVDDSSERDFEDAPRFDSVDFGLPNGFDNVSAEHNSNPSLLETKAISNAPLDRPSMCSIENSFGTDFEDTPRSSASEFTTDKEDKDGDGDGDEDGDEDEDEDEDKEVSPIPKKSTSLLASMFNLFRPNQTVTSTSTDSPGITTDSGGETSRSNSTDSSLDTNTLNARILESLDEDLNDFIIETDENGVEVTEAEAELESEVIISAPVLDASRSRSLFDNSKYLGVKFSYFAAFIRQHGGNAALKGKTTADVCRDFIQPPCKRTGMSVCEQLRGVNSPFVGFAQWFVSHTWGYQFLDTVDAIGRKLTIEYGEQANDVCVWFDIFSLPQLDVTLAPKYLQDTFTDTIARIKNVMMVLTPWEDPIALKRAWCVYELYLCNASGGNFHVAIPCSEVERFINSALSTKHFGKAISLYVDTSKCTASKSNETALIHSEIKSKIGFRDLDTLVLTCMLQYRAYAESLRGHGLELEKQGKVQLALTYYEEALMLRSLLKVEKAVLLTVMIYRARAYFKLHGIDGMYAPVLELYSRSKLRAITERTELHIRNANHSLFNLYKSKRLRPSQEIYTLLWNNGLFSGKDMISLKKNRQAKFGSSGASALFK